jgi:hypothetical protein
VLYVARNPKDAIVSFYHHHKLIKAHDYKGDLEEFAQYFMDDESMCAQPITPNFLLISFNLFVFKPFFNICGNLVVYSPFFPHLLDAWSKRNHPNLHFMFFEDMKKVIKAFKLLN